MHWLIFIGILNYFHLVGNDECAVSFSLYGCRLINLPVTCKTLAFYPIYIDLFKKNTQTLGDLQGTTKTQILPIFLLVFYKFGIRIEDRADWRHHVGILDLPLIRK